MSRKVALCMKDFGSYKRGSIHKVSSITGTIYLGILDQIDSVDYDKNFVTIEDTFTYPKWVLKKSWFSNKTHSKKENVTYSFETVDSETLEQIQKEIYLPLLLLKKKEENFMAEHSHSIHMVLENLCLIIKNQEEIEEKGTSFSYKREISEASKLFYKILNYAESVQGNIDEVLLETQVNPMLKKHREEMKHLFNYFDMLEGATGTKKKNKKMQ